MIPSHLNFMCLWLLFIVAIFPEKIAYDQMIRTGESQPNKELKSLRCLQILHKTVIHCLCLIL